MPFENGPYLQLAAFCERVIEDKEGVLSLIRVVDRVFHNAVGPGAPESMPPITVQLAMVIALKSGRARGRHSLTIRPESPSGLRQPEISIPVLLEGEDRGVNVVLNLNYQTDQEGLHWFDVLFGDDQHKDMITRMPLRIVYQRIVAGTPPTPGQLGPQS